MVELSEGCGLVVTLRGGGVDFPEPIGCDRCVARACELVKDRSLVVVEAGRVERITVRVVKRRDDARDVRLKKFLVRQRSLPVDAATFNFLLLEGGQTWCESSLPYYTMLLVSDNSQCRPTSFVCSQQLQDELDIGLSSMQKVIRGTFSGAGCYSTCAVLHM